MTKLIDRILQNCVRNENGCLIWQGGRSSGSLGYGCVRQGNHMLYVHREVFRSTAGDAFVPGLQVHHSCDVPNCCELGHLSQGTPQDNTDDAKKKGRLRGKLSKPEVELIIELSKQGGPFDADTLGVLYEVGRRSVKQIINGETWKQVQV